MKNINTTSNKNNNAVENNNKNEVSKMKKTLNNIVKNVQEAKNRNVNEEDTKMKLINPFINKILGFDMENFEETGNEYIEKIGVHNNNRIDYTLGKENKLYMIGEAKRVNRDIKKDMEQLFEYFKTTPVDLGFITNGWKYDFYCISENGRTMSTIPFFEFDITDYDDEDIEMLMKLTKENIDEEEVVQEAHHKKDKKLLNDYFPIAERLCRNYTEQFMRFNQGMDKEVAKVAATNMVIRAIFITTLEDKGIIEDKDTIKDALQKAVENQRIGKGSKKIHNRQCEIHTDIHEGLGNLPTIKAEILNPSYEHLIIPDTIEGYEKFFKTQETIKYPNEITAFFGEYYETINPIYKDILLLVNFNYEELNLNTIGKVFEKLQGVDEQAKFEGYYTNDPESQLICTETIYPTLSKTGKAKNCKEIIAEYKNNPKQLIHKIENNCKILDLACGAGSFLSKAMETLYPIYKKAYQLAYPGLEVHSLQLYENILKNNIYGVDLNSRAVPITKASLYLTIITSEKADIYKMDDINKHIKNGNSVISDPKIAGNLAFNWEKEFKDIINNGGFDIIVGNPPYQESGEIKPEEKEYLLKNYDAYTKSADLSVVFFEKALSLLKHNGIMGFISTNSFEKTGYGKKLRSLLLKNTIKTHIDYKGQKVFEGVNVDVSTTIIQKRKPSKEHQINCDNKYQTPQKEMTNNAFIYEKPEKINLRNKINSKGIAIKETDITMNRGITTGFNKAFIIDEETYKKLIKEDSRNKEVIKPLLRGRNVRKYNITPEKEYIIFTRGDFNKEEYPSIIKYLEQYKKDLTPKKPGETGKGRKPGTYKWFEIQDVTGYYKKFENNKVIYPEVCEEPSFAYDTSKSYTISSIIMNSETINPKILTGLLNSKTLGWIAKGLCNTLGQKGLRYTTKVVEQLSLVIPEDNTIANKVDEIMKLKENNKELKESFNNWFEIEFNKEIKFDETIEAKDFLRNNHVNGRKKQLEVTKEYNEVKEQITTNNNQINKLENEIDQIVYKLYDLTEEEIAIINNNY